MQGSTGLIPGQGTKIPHILGQLSPATGTPKPKPQLESQYTATKDNFVAQLGPTWLGQMNNKYFKKRDWLYIDNGCKVSSI